MSGRLRSRSGPLGHREFRLLFAGETVSLAGSAFAPIALAFAILDLTGSASDLGIVLAAAWLPQVVFVLIGGVVADRLPRSLILVGSNLASGAAQGIVAVLVLTGNAELWHLLVTQVVRGAAVAFFFPAIEAAIPQTVPGSLLQQANAVIRLSDSTTSIVGAAAGGALVAAAGPGWAFAFDSATYFVSALVLARMRRGGAVALGERRFLRELVEGWNEFRSRTWVWVVVLTSGISNLVWMGASGVLTPIVAREALGGAGAFGAIVAARSAGVLVGGGIALRFRPARPLVAGLVAWFGVSVSLATLALPAPLAVVLVAAVLSGVGLELFNVFFATSLQEHVSPERLARVMSYDALGSFVLIQSGLAVAGPAADVLGVSTALWAATAVAAAMVVAALLSADVRNLRRLARQPGETGADARSIAAS